MPAAAPSTAPPEREDFLAWQAENRAREALQEVAERRAVNVLAKDEASAVKMNYVAAVPHVFQQNLMAQRAEEAKRPIPTEVEKAAQQHVVERRAFAQHARAVFGYADKDNSLALDFDEVRNMSSSDDMAEYVIERFDGDGDGKISLAEWLVWIVPQWEKNAEGAKRVLSVAGARLMKRAYEAEALRIFRLADADGSGYLDYSEIEALMLDEMGLATFQEASMFWDIDADGDGHISEEEWLKFMVGVYEGGADFPPHPDLAKLILAHYEDRLAIRREEATFLELTKQLFTALDVDGSGSLDPREVSSFMTAEEETQAERIEQAFKVASSFIASFDADKSGSLELSEWQGFLLKAYRMQPGYAELFVGSILRVLQLRDTKAKMLASAEEMFHAYDTDQSGGLIISEVAAMLDGNAQLASQLKEQAAVAFIMEIDGDMSGSVELAEWQEFIKVAWREDPEQVQRFLKQLRANLRSRK